MKKAKIIIADKDQSYLTALLRKFIIELYGRADFEIISDIAYFDKLFKQQQMAEVLIVSEELYEKKLQRHDIEHIFLLADDKESKYANDASVSIIYKYSNIQDVFNEVLEKCTDCFNTCMGKREESRIVLFTSAAGGMGKTLAAVNMAFILAYQKKRVLYINSGRLQCFGYLFENCRYIYDNMLYSYMTDEGENIYQKIKKEIQNGEFDYLPPFKAALINLGLTADIFLKIAKGARASKDYDYIIMDTDSIFDETGAKELNAADKVVIITADNSKAIFETNRLTENINGINSDKYLIICFKHENRGKRDMHQEREKYEIDEYVDYQNKNDMNGYADLSMDKGLKKAAYLIGE